MCFERIQVSNEILPANLYETPQTLPSLQMAGSKIIFALKTFAIPNIIMF